MADEGIKSNLDAPLYGARVASPLCHLCANYDGLDKDWNRKESYRCKEYGDTPKEYFDDEWHRCPHFKPNEDYSIWHKDVPYDPDTWAEVVDKKAKEDEEYWSTPPWERGILKK